MTYEMFIDDERYPPTPDYMLARSSGEAIMFLKLYGMPSHIAFDHDLGGEDTSMLFIKYLEGALDRGEVEFPLNFTYNVHSMNPVGKQNIISYMECLLKYY